MPNDSAQTVVNNISTTWFKKKKKKKTFLQLILNGPNGAQHMNHAPSTLQILPSGVVKVGLKLIFLKVSIFLSKK